MKTYSDQKKKRFSNILLAYAHSIKFSMQKTALLLHQQNALKITGLLHTHSAYDTNFTVWHSQAACHLWAQKSGHRCSYNTACR